GGGGGGGVGQGRGQLNSLGGGDAEEVGDPPDQVAFEIVDAAVGISDLPHHFDHAAAAILVERAIDQTGEMIEIDRLVLGLRRVRDQLVRRRLVEAELPL